MQKRKANRFAGWDYSTQAYYFITICTCKRQRFFGQIQDEKMQLKVTRSLWNRINKLRSKYDVKINFNILEKISVSEENNPKAIDLYIVKKGGLIPRTPYPTVDNDWINWE